MTKTQLREKIGFSSTTLARMSKGEYVSLETIDNICNYFDCKIEDIIEFKRDLIIIDEKNISNENLKS